MTYTVVSGAWNNGTTAPDENCPGPNQNRVGRKRKKNDKGCCCEGCDYHHACVNVKVNSSGNIVSGYSTRDDLKYSLNGGHHPCKNLGESTLIGGGTNSHGNWSDYIGKSSNYENAEFAFKCSISDSVVDANIKNWSTSPHMTTARAKDDDGVTTRNLWQQIIYGITTPHVTNNPYCQKLENLSKVVHTDNRTCYDMIDEGTQRSFRVQHCRNNPTDDKCACYNVATHGTDGCITDAYKDLPGCSEVKEGFDSYPKEATSQWDVENFPTTCFATGICSRDGQYLPDSQPLSCEQVITVCTQDMNFYGNVSEGASVKINQKMDCEAKSGDAPSFGDGGGGGEVEGGGGGGGGGGGEASFTDFRSNPQAYIPKSVDDIKNDPKKKVGAMGIGGLIAIAMMMMLLLVVAGSAGGGGTAAPAAPVRRRRYR
jgi:hypothetical protein